MGLMRVWSLLICVLWLTGCAGDADVDVNHVPATITAEDGGWVIVSDSTEERYVPRRLPLSYREDGLRIFVTGRSFRLPAESLGTDLGIEISSLVDRERVESN